MQNKDELVRNFWRMGKPAEICSQRLGVSLPDVERLYAIWDGRRDTLARMRLLLEFPKLFFIITCVLFSGNASAQVGISPLVSEIHADKKGRARGEFTVTNGSVLPMVTVLEARTIT